MMITRLGSAQNTRGGPGFTLIELLVVIAIISLLVGILLPSLAGVRDRGRTAVCASNLRQMGIATLTYANDNKSIYSSGAWDNRQRRSWGALDRAGWVADFMNGGYLVPGRFMCTNSTALGSEVWNPAKVNGSDAWRTFSDEERVRMINEGFNTNYTQSWYMAHSDPKTTSALTDVKDRLETKGPLRDAFLSIAPTSKVPLFADTKAEALDNNNWLEIDGQRVTGAKSLSDGPTAARSPSGQNVSGRQVYLDFGPAHGRSNTVYVGQIRHNRNIANMVFADGSVGELIDAPKRDGLFDSSVKTINGWIVRSYDDIEGRVYGGWLTFPGLNF
jgi:prepilin-type N-terminal cleavage/methylation domain-containing protein/prepilin-type processing-associated H-X9-DG protein